MDLLPLTMRRESVRALIAPACCVGGGSTSRTGGEKVNPEAAPLFAPARPEAEPLAGAVLCGAARTAALPAGAAARPGRRDMRTVPALPRPPRTHRPFPNTDSYLLFS